MAEQGCLPNEKYHDLEVSNILTLGTTIVSSSALELNILNASEGNIVVASDGASTGGNITSNNFKIKHTLTLDGNLANDHEKNLTVANDKVLDTSVVLASSNLKVQLMVHTVVAGSFIVTYKNLTGGQLNDDSTIIINYRII